MASRYAPRALCSRGAIGVRPFPPAVEPQQRQVAAAARSCARRTRCGRDLVVSVRPREYTDAVRDGGPLVAILAGIASARLGRVPSRPCRSCAPSVRLRTRRPRGRALRRRGAATARRGGASAAGAARAHRATPSTRVGAALVWRESVNLNTPEDLAVRVRADSGGDLVFCATRPAATHSAMRCIAPTKPTRRRRCQLTPPIACHEWHEPEAGVRPRRSNSCVRRRAGPV